MEYKSRETNARSIGIAACTFAALVCATSALAQDRAGWPNRLTMATGPVGGTGYSMASPWAAVVGTAVGVPISVEATAGFPINARMVNAKQAEIGMSTTSVAYEASRGSESTGGKPLVDLRGILVFDANVMQIYASPKSGLRSLSDLAGKRIAPSRARSEADTVMRAIFSVLDIKPGRIVNLSPTQANDLLRDGQIDAAAGTGNVPHPAATEFEAGSELALIGFSDRELELFLARNPSQSKYTIPANTFKGQTQPVNSVGSYIMMLVNKDLPDTLVYDLVKKTFESKTMLGGAYKSYQSMSVDNIHHLTIPLHPGALKYYEEKGVKVAPALRP